MNTKNPQFESSVEYIHPADRYRDPAERRAAFKSLQGLIVQWQGRRDLAAKQRFDEATDRSQQALAHWEQTRQAYEAGCDTAVSRKFTELQDACWRARTTQTRIGQAFEGNPCAELRDRLASSAQLLQAREAELEAHMPLYHARCQPGAKPAWEAAEQSHQAAAKDLLEATLVWHRTPDYQLRQDIARLLFPLFLAENVRILRTMRGGLDLNVPKERRRDPRDVASDVLAEYLTRGTTRFTLLLEAVDGTKKGFQSYVAKVLENADIGHLRVEPFPGGFRNHDRKSATDKEATRRRKLAKSEALDRKKNGVRGRKLAPGAANPLAGFPGELPPGSHDDEFDSSQEDDHALLGAEPSWRSDYRPGSMVAEERSDGFTPPQRSQEPYVCDGDAYIFFGVPMLDGDFNFLTEEEELIARVSMSMNGHDADDLEDPVKIEEAAEALGLSVSTFKLRRKEVLVKFKIHFGLA